ncbi:MAG: DUF3429 domain-containing protein [Nitratireductor sp.]
MDNLNIQKHKKSAWYLSIAGLFPFIIIAGAMLILGRENTAIDPLSTMFKTYSAVIITFIGGIRWGHIIHEDNDRVQTGSLIMSVLPAIVAWLILLVPQEYEAIAILILLVGFCAHGAWDSISAYKQNLPHWFGQLRIRITFIVAICHIAVFTVIA